MMRITEAVSNNGRMYWENETLVLGDDEYDQTMAKCVQQVLTWIENKCESGRKRDACTEILQSRRAVLKHLDVSFELHTRRGQSGRGS